MASDDDEFPDDPDDGDYPECMTCGRPVTDGGGLYCSARCEETGNPGSEGL